MTGLMLSDLIKVDRSGYDPSAALWAPDLDSAEDAADTISILDRAASEGLPTYAIFWFNRVEALGGHASVMVDRNGTESFSAGTMCDAQMEKRRERLDALIAHFRGVEGSRAALIQYANHNGIFSDNRPYDTAEEALQAIVGTGARLLVEPDGNLSIAPVLSKEMLSGVGARWSEARRAQQRYENTLRCTPGATEHMVRAIRERGVLCENGWHFLEALRPVEEASNG